jgi:putative sporulation protein YtxC
MKLFACGLKSVDEDFKSKLTMGCLSLTQEGFKVGIDEMQKGKYTFLNFNILEGELSFRNYERVKGIFRKIIAQSLTELILTQEEPALIKRLIEKNFNYFNKEDQDKIFDLVKNVLNEHDYCKRNILINERFVEYLETHHEVVLEGFITFKLKDYNAMLSQAVDKAVDDFMLDAEYKEFIRVLKYFVDVQDSRTSIANVIINSNNSFKILDDNNKVINPMHGVEDADINYEDLLVSALITLAPHELVVHNPNGVELKQLKETLENVFEGRITFCKGCEICEEDL